MPKMPVAVVDRGLLTRALDVCVEAGYRVRAAYSEIYTVPAPAAGVLSVRMNGGRGVARSATHDGFAFELSDDGSVPPALALAVRQLGVRRIHIYGRDSAKLSALAGKRSTCKSIQSSKRPTPPALIQRSICCREALRREACSAA